MALEKSDYAHENIAVPEVGLQFKTFSDIKRLMRDYSESIQEVFTKQRCTCLTSNDMEARGNKELRYRHIYYACKYGCTRYRNESQNIRKTRSFKVDCPAFIEFYLSRDKEFLEIKKTNLTHENHIDSGAFYKYLPEIRRLVPEEHEMAVKALQLRCNKKMLQTKLINEYDKFVSLKDLSNIQSTLRHKDDLTEMVDLLIKKGASPRILSNNDRFKCLYFSTLDMSRSMNAWPEILFIDGTYKLLKTNLTVMILLVEDSNASSEIVAVGLFATEDYTTFKWFLTEFKSENISACTRIISIMGDKDLLERDVLKEVFPNVPIYICLSIL